MKFPTFTLILKVFQYMGIFLKTSLTSNYEIWKDKRQVDELSFKRSLVDERKLGLELWSLLLKLTPMEDALVDYTHLYCKLLYMSQIYCISNQIYNVKASEWLMHKLAGAFWQSYFQKVISIDLFNMYIHQIT